MPYQVLLGPRFLTVTFSGALKFDDLRNSLNEAADLVARARPAPPRLTDLSETSAIELDFNLMQIFTNDRQRLSYANSFKSAIVAKSAVQYGFARMFEILADHPQIEVRSFRDRAAAEAWLGTAATLP